MNVSVDVIVGLANVMGVGHGLKAEGVARIALERLKGEKEYRLEAFDVQWEAEAIYDEPLEALRAYAYYRETYPGRRFRLVELIRRVLP